MSVCIEIHPLSDSLVMYGKPDTSSAYSLSGHVSVSLKSLFSFFERRRATRILLKSITLEFEGQSEIATPAMGYASTRLCSITRELIDEPMELTNEGHENEPCTWNVVFNVPIPGWLPATSILGEFGTRFFLYANAQFTYIDDSAPTIWSTLCSPFRFSRTKAVETQADVLIKRFINAPAVAASDSSVFPSVTYKVSNCTTAPTASSTEQSIPARILSKIQVLASVPECIEATDSAFPLKFRLRTDGLDDEECSRLKITQFTLDITQTEKYRSRPSSEYLTKFPIPGIALQPPNKALRSAHPVSTMYEMGLGFGAASLDRTGTRKLSLFPSTACNRYVIGGDNHVFANDDSTSWYTMDTDVPFEKNGTSLANDDLTQTLLTSGTNGPNWLVRHDLNVSLTCQYNLLDGQGTASDVLRFNIPLNFAYTMQSVIWPRSVTPPPLHSYAAANLSAPELTTTSQPHSVTLPAYSQLFDSNGDQKIDYSVPLPLYTPSSPTPSTLSLPSETEAKFEESH